MARMIELTTPLGKDVLLFRALPATRPNGPPVARRGRAGAPAAVRNAAG